MSDTPQSARAAGRAAAATGTLSTIVADAGGDAQRLTLAQYTSCKVCGASVTLRDLVRLRPRPSPRAHLDQRH